MRSQKAMGVFMDPITGEIVVPITKEPEIVVPITKVPELWCLHFQKIQKQWCQPLETEFCVLDEFSQAAVRSMGMWMQRKKLRQKAKVGKLESKK